MKAIFSIGLLLAFTRCSILQPPDARFRRIVSPNGSNSKSGTSKSSSKDYVSVDLFTTKVSDDESSKISTKTLWDLKGKGQAEYIDKVSTMTDDARKSFGDAISAKYFEEEKPTVVDLTKKHIKIVLSVSKILGYKDLGAGFSPADRIENLKAKLSLQQSSDNSRIAKFISWDKFQTSFATIKISDVTFSSSISGRAGVGDTTIVGAGVNASASRTDQETIQYKYATLNGELAQDSLKIEEQGTRETDLVGNIILDVNLKFEPHQAPGLFCKFEDLFDKSGHPNSCDKVKFNPQFYLYPATNQPLSATLEYGYTYRSVISGYKTFIESDDKVSFITINGKKSTIALIDKDDIIPKRWYIILCKGITETSINLQLQNDQLNDIEFSSYNEAANFATWLNTYQWQQQQSSISFGFSKVLVNSSDIFDQHSIEKYGRVEVRIRKTS